MKIIRTKGRGAARTAEILAALERRGGAALDAVLPTVKRIVANVRKHGDRALLRYAVQFDALSDAATLRITQDEMAAAWNAIDPSIQLALRTAAAQIRTFAQWQMPTSWDKSPIEGLTTGQLVRPLDAVGCYVPSGRHPLPSTLLMTAIPAQVAGVARVVVVSPKPAPETLAAAHLLGISEFYRAGGAHAIAALAYGTATIPRVDKIVGPGNLYVTAAKRLVAFDCAIDMLAGPTEALDRHGLVVAASTIEEARMIANRLAPEHLTVDSHSDLDWVQNAGSVFVGRWSAQPLGDYISGPNHTLPTGGMARVRGGLSVNDFVKLITVQEYSAKAARSLGEPAALLAEAEGLTAHAEAIRARFTRRPRG